MKFKRLKISDWRQFNEVSIDFHNKVTVITGSNGAGKSTVLRILAKHFSWNCDFLAMPFYDEDKGINIFTNKRQSNSYSNANHKIGEIEYSNEIISSIYIEEHPRTINYDIAIENIDRSIKGLFIHSHRASNNYEITSNIPTGVINAEDSYKNHLQAYKKHLENSSFNGNPTVEMKQSLLSMAALGVGNNYIKKNKKSEKTFTSFIEILKITLPKNIGFKNIRFEVPDVIFETDSGDFVLDSASGGIMSIIDISWQILLYSQDAEHFTALIDEPENHLHPTMQRSLINDLIKAFPNVQFVIVTHSPFIISSVKDSNVYALKHDDSNKVNSHKLDLEEKASTANKILRDVLGVSI
ncbi:AAA family ATPase, partial [Salmonella enterica]|nr:AAA family ATPase [Salmonella enterica]EIX3830212.1 AAA family ATPase [Salmonella enterica]